MAFLRALERSRFPPPALAWWGKIWLCLGCIPLLVTMSPVAAQEIQAPEPEVKAAFLYNFTKLVTWPKSAFASNSAPLVVGVLGKDPFGKNLDTLLAGRTVGVRRIQAERFKSGEAFTNCHVLFISDSERRRLGFILAELSGKPILTVGDYKGFAEQGMIELVKTNSNISLSINLVAANRAGLTLSSHLTRLDRNLRPPAVTNSPPARPGSPR
jgi:hypothetical protein